MQDKVVEFKRVPQEISDDTLKEKVSMAELMQLLIKEVADLKEIVLAYQSSEKQTLEIDKDYSEEWANQREISKEEIKEKLLNNEGISLEAWLYSKGISLDKSTKHRFALLVAETYKNINKHKPPTGTGEIEGVKKFNVFLYTIEDVPILQVCLNKILA